MTSGIIKARDSIWTYFATKHSSVSQDTTFAHALLDEATAIAEKLDAEGLIGSGVTGEIITDETRIAELWEKATVLDRDGDIMAKGVNGRWYLPGAGGSFPGPTLPATLLYPGVPS